MKLKPGFYFGPRNKLPGLQIKVEFKLVVDPEVRPAHISHPPDTGIGLWFNSAFPVTFLISSPNLCVSSLSCFLLFWLHLSLFK